MSNQDNSQDALLGTIAGGAIWSFGGRVAKLCLLFLVEIMMARFLGLSSYGGITLAVVTLNLGSMLGGLGMSQGIIRKVPLYEKEQPKARGAIWSALTWVLVGSTIVGASVFVAASFIATEIVQNPDTVWLFRIAGLAMPFSALTGVGISTAKAFNDATTHVAVRQLFIPLSRAIAIPALIAAGFGAVYATMGIAVSVALGGVLAIYLGFRHIPFKLTGPRELMLGEMLTFSFPLVLASGMQFVITNTDTVLVGVFLSTTSVGTYNVALNIHNLGWLFFYPVTTLIGPVLTRLERDDRVTDAKRTYQVSTKWMSLLTFPFFLLVFLFPEVVIGVTFGSAATAGADALRVLILAPMFSVLMGANGGALVSFGHSRIQMYGNATAAGINILLNVLLIPRYGITGAAIATAFALGMKNVVYSARLYQAHGIHPFSHSLTRSIASVLPVVVIGYVAFVRLFPVRFVTVTAIGLLFLVAYGFIVIRVGGIEQEDIDVVNRFEQSKNVDLDCLRTLVKRLQA